MVTLLKIGQTYNSSMHKTYLIDSKSDVASLPDNQSVMISERCAPGSVAYTPDLKVIFILGNDNQWHDASEEV